MICALFGHRDTPVSIKENLKKTILELIDCGACKFLVGNNGAFDALAQEVLFEIAQKRKMSYYIVISYLNERVAEHLKERTIYPEGLEMVPRRFSIVKRNEWILKQASVAVVYVKNSQGNCYRLQEKAKKRNMRIINLAK